MSKETMIARLKATMGSWTFWTRRQRQQVARSEKFLQRMRELATVMDEDVDIVTERFEAFASQVVVSWATVYLPAYARALDGKKDPWFYGDDADTQAG